MTATAIRGEDFVDVRRGERVESVHRVAGCAVDRDGRILLAIGDIDMPCYLRSTAKPFISGAILREGVADHFALEAREIAVMTASHNGEAFHVEAVRSILRKIGLTESALQCGPAAPYDVDSARALLRAGVPFSAVHNNCSGKHAGILALCQALGADTKTYLDRNNGAQRLILSFCARMSEQNVDDLPLAVDGCGIPVYATPLRNAARAFARFSTLDGIDEEDAKALGAVRAAMIAYPLYVGGTGEFDSVLMAAADGAIAAKSGAEGVHGAALVTRGVGLVLKVIDGASRAVPPAALRLLGEAGLLEPSVRDRLVGFDCPVIRNRAGLPVGRIEAR